MPSADLETPPTGVGINGSSLARETTTYGSYGIARGGTRCAVWMLLVLLSVLTGAASQRSTTLRVSRGQDLQAAIDAARPGDTILLDRGATFEGNFVLPARPAAAQDAEAFVTIRTDAPGLPGPGSRIAPASAGTLAVLRSPNSDPSIRTAAGAHHWRLENLEIAGTRNGAGAIVALGDATQRALSAAPHDIILDRVYIHGDPLLGQRRGIALNSASTRITGSYIADIKALGVDTQAIGGWNGPGPYVIENNYLEAAGENIMFGGADPAIPMLVPSDITIRGNLVSRPTAWRAPILQPPSDVHGTIGTDSGALPPGRYTYAVVAARAVAGGEDAVSDASAVVTVTVPTGQDASVVVTWAPRDEATTYRIYRLSSSGDAMSWRTSTARFVDTGAAGKAGKPPRHGSVWTVKNLLELKNARNVVIENNIFEHHWAGAQAGYAIVFTPRNQDGHALWSTVEHVRFADNRVRHVSSGINITGTDDEHASGRTKDIVIAGNVFEDVDGKRWGGRGDFLQIGDGPEQVRVEGNTVDNSGRILSVYGSRRGRQIVGLIFKDNLVRHNRYGVMGTDASPGTTTFDKYLPQVVFAGNVIAGGDPSKYPAGNRFVGAAEFQSLLARAVKP